MSKCLRFLLGVARHSKPTCDTEHTLHGSLCGYSGTTPWYGLYSDVNAIFFIEVLLSVCWKCPQCLDEACQAAPPNLRLNEMFLKYPALSHCPMICCNRESRSEVTCAHCTHRKWVILCIAQRAFQTVDCAKQSILDKGRWKNATVRRHFQLRFDG